MRYESSTFTHLAGLCGMFAPVLLIGLILAAVSRSPWFSWHDNALSDMGVHPAVASLFNTVLIAGGVFNVIFAAGLAVGLPRGVLTTGGSLALVTASVLLSFVGILPESYGTLHNAVAIGYYLLTPVAYLLIGAGFWLAGARIPGVCTLAAGLAILLVTFFTPHHGVAVPEMLGALIISCWTFAIGASLALGQ